MYNRAISIKNCAINNAKKAVSFVTNVEYKKNFAGLKTNMKPWFEYLLIKKKKKKKIGMAIRKS